MLLPSVSSYGSIILHSINYLKQTFVEIRSRLKELLKINYSEALR